MTASSTARVFLRPGADRRVGGGHPWAYSNEIRMDEPARALAPGTLATLHRTDGKPLGVGTFNPHTLIAFRVFDRDAHATIGRDWLAARLQAALDLRTRLYAEPFYRLVHAEGDGLPGLVLDRYGDVMVAQVNTAGMEALWPHVLAALDAVCAPRAVVLRNDSRARAAEGLPTAVRMAKGQVDERVPVREGGLVFPADLLTGQKTGWYYDQRDNRAFVAALARGGRVLDAYCYGGGFAVAAARAGAESVLGIDSSDPALALAGEAAEANGVAARCTFTRGDAFAELERLAAAGERFSLVAADPPAFVRSRKELKSGVKGYRKLARLAASLVEPGGFLFLASCSHNVDADLFAAETAAGMARAGRGGRIVRAAGAGADHPVNPWLPETAYLKTLLLQVD